MPVGFDRQNLTIFVKAIGNISRHPPSRDFSCESHHIYFVHFAGTICAILSVQLVRLFKILAEVVMKRVVIGMLMSFFILQANADSAFEEVQQMAFRGDAKAQFDLAMRYRSGRGVEKDDEQSLRWLMESANQNHLDAVWHMGHIYENGKSGVTKDYAAAAYWYLKLAQSGPQNNEMLQNGYTNIGAMYLTAEAPYANYQLGAEWLARSYYETGDRYAASMLGEMYYNGTAGAPVDYVLAKEWSERAAEKGEMIAMRLLALMHLEGVSGTPDVTKAREWIIEGAAKGDPAAKKTLSLLGG